MSETTFAFFHLLLFPSSRGVLVIIIAFLQGCLPSTPSLGVIV